MVTVSPFFFSRKSFYKIYKCLTLHVSLAMELAVVFISQKSTCRKDSEWKLLMEPKLTIYSTFYINTIENILKVGTGASMFDDVVI